MRDYLKAKEQEEFLLMKFIAIEGERLLESWEKTNNLTNEEREALNLAIESSNKFVNLVFQRLDKKIVDTCNKRLSKYQFRFIDDYQLNKIMRVSEDRMKQAVIDRDHWDTFCENIMDIRCKGCTTHFRKCPHDLYDGFDENFTPEPDAAKDNCKYAY